MNDLINRTDDLISRQALIEHLRRTIEASSNDGDYSEGFNDGMDFAACFASTLPSVQPEQKTIRINLNETVKVKLTDFGWEIHRQRCNAANDFFGEDVFRPEQLKKDENGYVRYQLWSFINEYGKYIGLAYPNVIEPLEIVCERRTDE